MGFMPVFQPTLDKEIMALEFYNLIKRHAEKAHDHPAIIDGEAVITYGQLLEQVELFAGGLSNL